MTANGDGCGEKHPNSWWITCQLKAGHSGEHVHEYAPRVAHERVEFGQHTVRWPVVTADVWHVLSSTDLVAMLRRCHAGEDPEMVYLEEYVNAERPVEDDDA